MVSKFLSAAIMALAAACSGAVAVGAAEPPYPPSDYITKMTLDWATYRRDAQEADNWHTTWASDGKLYSSWGDGGGLGAGAEKISVSIGLARLSGSTAASVTGQNLVGGLSPSLAKCFPSLGLAMERRARGKHVAFPCVGQGLHAKSWSLLALDRTLYMFVSPGSTTKGYEEARLVKAPLGSAKFAKADWAFRRTDNVPLLHPNLAQAGRNLADSAHVYAYATRYAPFKDYGLHKGPGNAGEIHLLRAAKGADLMRRESWEFYAGSPGSWTRSQSGSRAVILDPNAVGWNTSAIYDKGLGRWLVSTQHEDRSAGKIGIFEAPEPYGPWRTVYYETLSNAEKDVPPRSYYAAFLANSFAEGGSRFTLTFTGGDVLDSLNLVDGRFTLNAGAKDRATGGGRP